MGSNFSVYVGTAIKIVSKKIETEEELSVCEGCGKKINTPFCSSCGGRRGSLTRKVFVDFDISNFLEENNFEDTYTSLDEYIPNYIVFNEKNKFHFWIEGDCDKFLDIPDRASEVDLEDIITALKDNNIEFQIKHGILPNWG